MGKSFLLEHIEREIDRRQERDPDAKPRVHVVRFNAWEYSAAEIVWPGLVRKILTRLDELTTWPWHKRLLTRMRWNLRRRWQDMGIRLAAVALVVAVGIAVAFARGASALGAVLAGGAAVASVGGLVKAAKDPVANWITALFAGSDYGRQLGVMEEIRHDLLTLERRLHRRGDGDDVVTGRILVLIDDLDRCEPGKAVEVLQAVNLLLNFPSFVVCLGIDARIVTGAIEKHYEGLLGKAGASGYEYLDKIVQIPFRIPEPGPGELMDLVAAQMGDPRPGTDDERSAVPVAGEASLPAVAGSAVDETPEPRLEAQRSSASEPGDPSLFVHDPVPFTYAELEAFQGFARQLRPNPRHIKRVVNVYRLVRALAWQMDERLILDRPAATIRWLLMWSQWPYASLAMLEEYDRQMAEWGGVVPEQERDVDPLQRLLARSEDRGLDVALRERLDDELDPLRDLLAAKEGRITWEEIGRIRRYTVNFNPAVEEEVLGAVV